MHDIMREWIKANPIKMENIREGSPARKLLSIEQMCVVVCSPSRVSLTSSSDSNAVDLSPHPDVAKATLSDVKLVRYQVNPQANWGPAKAAVKGAKGKKSKSVDAEGE